jgi:hypothetical protein
MTKLDELMNASMADLIAYFTHTSNLALMASICIDREKGLKKQANAHTLSFIEATQKLTIAEQRAITLELCELYFFTHFQPLTTPLLRYFIAVMQDWVAAEPKNDVPLCWLAYLNQDRENYARAYAINPNNAFALSWVIHEHLNDADMQTHVSHAIKELGDVASLRNTLSTAKNRLDDLQKLIALGNVQYANYINEKLSSLMAEYDECLSIYNQWLSKNKTN